jgi:hypothetical protein
MNLLKELEFELDVAAYHAGTERPQPTREFWLAKARAVLKRFPYQAEREGVVHGVNQTLAGAGYRRSTLEELESL